MTLHILIWSRLFCIAVPVCIQLHLFLSLLLLFADAGLLDTRTSRIKLTAALNLHEIKD